MAKMMIALQAVLLSILCLCMWEEASSTREMNQTIPSDCPSTCGEVDIPYPFGVGEWCSRDKGFEIMCNYTRDKFGYYSFTPFLAVNRNEVGYISLENELIMVKASSTKRCNKNTSGKRQGAGYMVFNFTHSPFTSSAQMNTLVGRGCDVFARITDLTNQKFVSGCVSMCPTDVPTYELCSGIGCCQAPVPKGLKAFNVTLEPLSIETKSSAFNSDGCSYASLEDSSYDASLEGKITPTTTLYLNWAIGNKTCKEAKKNLTSYACKDPNSDCSESPNGLGYVCKCHEGYNGNAYLPNGCYYVGDCNNCVDHAYCSQDSDENVYCYCPSGWTGDGRKSGSGCTSTRIRSTRSRYILIGVAVGVVLLLSLLVASFILIKKWMKRRHINLKKKFFKQNGGLLLEQQISSGEGNIEKTKVYVAEELEKATDSFNESRILGRGGSGTVYKGMLSDGRIVAVKKSKIVDESQIGQFINELVILSHINHRHVVQLFGCCLETEVPLLAYEFVSNGTLSHHLHDEECHSSMSWDDRLRIATEIAGALSYMHSSATTPIFHRDIKSTNILLDENFKAKISDFGISRSVPYENTHLTTLVQGTFGYLDPEYFHSGQFTDKSDVYSFGIVVVELLTGLKPVSSTRPEEEKNLAMYFISSMKQNRVFEILETRLRDEGSKEELLVVAKIAKRCLKLVGKKRPTMREVSIKLEQLRNGEGQQRVPQNHEDANHQDTKYLRYDSSSITISGPESDDTKLI